MYKSMLIAMDESEASKTALNIGLELAKFSDAKVKGLYVEDVMRLLEWQPTELIGAAIGSGTSVPSSRPTVEQVEVEKEFIKECNNLERLFNDKCKEKSIYSTFIKKRGKVDNVIIDETKTTDILVIGRRGETYPEESNEPGPVTENILRATTRPVFVVPPGVSLGSNILIAYDGSNSSQRALSAGANLAKLMNSNVRVVSVADDIDTAEKPLNEAKEYLSAYRISSTFIIEFGVSKPWKGIMQQAANFKAGLIVLGAFGENKLLEMIFGSTTKEVLTQAKCPILLCR